ncbi:MAG: toll/interleukin-1 receptor domain-containing protein [Verrucomicrobiae bacterium]|nr:toll/interleukin-1 receptor domain-containing protein [Verrucomicrobiae bacterium]
MAEAGFPRPVAEVVMTLSDIFRHQRKSEITEVLESVHAWFDNTRYDNWNGGTYTWALRLEVPVPIFALVEPRLSEIEKEIREKLSYFTRLYPDDHLNEVTVSPIAPGSSLAGQWIAPSEVEVRRLWPEGRVRLFLSHVAKYKAAVSNLKDELELFGITAFVAHEAIQPSLEWQREIELALRSMHGLLALITPDFHASHWTDQEVGWALGRGVLVVPVRLGADPYGFAGKVQGNTGDFEQSKGLARAVFETLLTNPQTHGEVRRAFVKAFCESASFNQSILLCAYIPRIADFTDEEKAAMKDACESNDQLTNAQKVPETIYKAFGKPKKKPAEASQESDDVPF